MNLENTKVYTTDPEVIRKYAELCGKEIEQPNGKFKGYYSPASHGKVCYFIYHSCVDSDDEFKTITTDKINALYIEKFGDGNNTEFNVDSIATETPEEAEVLNSIKSIEVEWNGEGLPPIGVECKVNRDSFIYRVMYSSKYVVIVQNTENDGTSADGMDIILDLHKANYTFRKPENEAERKERERLEAAIDLHDLAQDAYFAPDGGSDGSAVWDKAPERVKSMYLAIVDKTGYRKQKNGD